MPPERDRADGILVSWNDDRGFGFVQAADGSPNLFVHISGFGAMDGRPEVGDVLSYRRRMAEDGRLQAFDVRGPGKLTKQPARVGIGSLAVIGVFLAAFVMINSVYPILSAIPAFYGAFSILTFFVYALDKRRARTNGWRVSETTLLLLGLVGGWPGAIVAQLALRHKTRKASFRVVFWWTVVINLLVFFAVTTPYLFDALNRV